MVAMIWGGDERAFVGKPTVLYGWEIRGPGIPVTGGALNNQYHVPRILAQIWGRTLSRDLILLRRVRDSLVSWLVLREI